MTRLYRFCTSRTVLSGLITLLLGGTLTGSAFADEIRSSDPPRKLGSATTPTITAMTGPVDSTYAIGDILQFTVEYDETVEVSGSPFIELDIGGSTQSAAYVSGSGTQTLTFEYTVQEGDDDTDGISFASTSIQDGTLEDDAGEDSATRDFSAEAPSLGGVLTDGTPPTITGFSASNPSGQDVQVTVEADEPLVPDGDSIEVTLSGPETATLTGTDFTETSSGGPWVYTATYAASSDGTYTATLTTARDTAGNDGAGGETADATVDSNAPTIANATLSSDNAQVRVGFSEGVYANIDGTGGLAAGDFSVSLAQNGGNVTAASISDVTDPTGAAPTGGEDSLHVVLSLTGTPASGEETVELQPADGSSIYDASGLAMEGTETTGVLSLHDRAAPTSLTIDQPGSEALRASTSAFGGDTSLDVGYSYDEVNPDTTTLTFTDGSNTATFGVSDEGYVADGSEKTVTLDLTNPDTENGGLADNTTYSIQIVATDAEGNAETTITSGLLTIDNTAPSVLDVSLGNDGSDNLALTLDTDEELATPSSALEVSIAGPTSGTGWTTVTRTDFSETDNGDGTFTYTLTTEQGYTDGGGTYTASVETARDGAGNDGADGSDTASHTFNTEPTAVADRDTTSEDNTLSQGAPGVLANDSDPDGDPLSVIDVNGSSPGSQITLSSGALLTVNGDGSYTYDPNGQFETLAAGDTTTDTFTYRIEDAAGATDQTTGTLVVAGVNDAPTLRDSTFATTEDDTLFQAAPGVLGNDTDPEGDALQVTQVNGASTVGSEVTLPSGATLTMDGNGSFTYVPTQDQIDTLAVGETVTDSFSYTATDGNGGSGTATASVEISGQNDPPLVETNDVLAVSTTGDSKTITTSDLSATDPDTNPQNLTFSVTSGPSNGTLIVDGTSGAGSFTQKQLQDGVVVYQHDGTSTTTDGFSFDLTDAEGAGPGVTPFDIVIGLNNSAPTATADDSSTTEDDVLAVTDSANGVLRNDTDSDGDPLVVSEVNGVSANVGVQIELTSGALLTINEDGTYTYDPNGRFDDLDSGDTNSESVSYTVADGRGGNDTATLSITISGVNDAPTLDVNTGLVVERSATETITILDLSASDPDDPVSEITFAVTSGPSQGRLLVDGSESSQFTQQSLADGEVAYEHTSSAPDDDQFTFRVSDADITGPTGQTFDITVSATNLPPTARDTTIATNEDTVAVGTAPGILGNDSDPDGDALSVSGVNGGSGGNVGSQITLSSGALLTVRGNGSYEYDPNDQFENLQDGETASDSFTYRASDGNGGSDQATVSVTIDGANEVPSVTLDAPAPGTVVGVGDDLRIEASASDEDGSIQEVTFRAGGTDIGTDTTPSDGFRVTWTPQTAGTVPVTAAATDDAGATVETADVNVYVRPAAVGVSVERQFPTPTSKSGFRLVALPGEANQTVESTLSDLPTDDWRAFRETGATDTLSYNRERCSPGNCTLRSGNGYWLIARQPWSVEDSIDTVPLRPGSTDTAVYGLAVHEGWNIISNPLEVDVAWAAVQSASGTSQTLWRWNGSWERASTFTSASEGEAYYFRDDQLDSLFVPFQATGSASGPVAAGASKRRKGTVGKGPSADLTLRIEAAGETTSSVRAGIRAGSEVAFDATDRYGPPGYFGGATLRLVERSEDERHILSAERKPPGRDGYAYDIRLQSRRDTTVRLVTEGMSSFSQEQISLVRRSTGRTYDLRADSVISVVAEYRTTRFRLLIGSDDFVEEARKDLVPETAVLRPNYPEPFRQQTTLEYSLPERQHVRLSVYDVLGRHVETVVNGRKAAGFHQVRWPSSGGRSMASGVYFVRLKAGTTTKTERVVVVR